MSRFFHTIASILLSAAVLVAAQILPTHSINRSLKMERVDEAINEATDFDVVAAAAAASKAHEAHEAKRRKTMFAPVGFEGLRKTHVPPSRIRAALRSGNVDALATDIFIGVYTVRCPKSQPQPRSAAPPTTTFADIMRIPSHIPKVKSARLRWLDQLLASHPEIDGCTEEGRNRLKEIAIAADEARRPAARPKRAKAPGVPTKPLKPAKPSTSGNKPWILEKRSLPAR